MNNLYKDSTFRVVVFDRNGYRLETSHHRSAYAMYRSVESLEKSHLYAECDIEVYWIDKHGTIKQVNY